MSKFVLVLLIITFFTACGDKKVETQPPKEEVNINEKSEKGLLQELKSDEVQQKQKTKIDDAFKAVDSETAKETTTDKKLDKLNENLDDILDKQMKLLGDGL